MTALGEIQCPRSRLECFDVLLLGILSVKDLVPSELLILALIVIGRIEVELIIDDGVEPLAICST